MLSIQELAKAIGKTIFPVEGDGNCFFNATFYSLTEYQRKLFTDTHGSAYWAVFRRETVRWL